MMHLILRVHLSQVTAPYRLHDLRHFFASGLINAGCDVVTVQRALGHSSPSVTLDTYGHLWPKANDRTRNAANALFEESLGAAADGLRTDCGRKAQKHLLIRVSTGSPRTG
jgi:hypothetical protein